MVGLPPDFLSRLLALANLMRLSLLKGAHANLFGPAYRKSRSPVFFGPGTLWRTWGTRPIPIAVVLTLQCFVRGAVSPVVYCVADGGGGQVAAAHLVFGNAAQSFGYRMLGDGVRLVHGFA